MRSLANWIAIVALVGYSNLASAERPTDGAKGLFFEQLSKPTEKLNTGLQFWIELHRHGQTLRADNRAIFQSGDKIRFHVTPNIDGYAYILLRSGSRGEQAQLFPLESLKENNQITRGKEIALPTEGTLDFDDNPGVEKLTMLISRTAIDPKPYLNNPDEGSGPLIIKLSAGSKDLIPTNVLVSYMSPSQAAPVILPAADKKSGKVGGGATIVQIKTGTITKLKSSRPKQSQKSISREPRSGVTAGRKSARELISKKPNDNPDHPHLSVVTVVYKDPSGVLAADITLRHL